MTVRTDQNTRPGASKPTSEVAAVLKANRGVFISACAFSCLVNLLMLTGPLFMLQVYDRVLSSGSVPTLVALAVIVVILFGYYGFLDYLRARLLVRIGRRVEERLRDRVFEAVTWHALRRTPDRSRSTISRPSASSCRGRGPSLSSTCRGCRSISW